ncbi:MAG: hypothetical protein FJ247_12270 [Nitrospira sp.]|nr:hypothetical protein [Nitrospira sp.]
MARPYATLANVVRWVALEAAAGGGTDGREAACPTTSPTKRPSGQLAPYLFFVAAWDQLAASLIHREIPHVSTALD